MIPICHTVWIQHGDNLKHEVAAEIGCNSVIAREKIQSPFHHPGGVRFTGVDSR
jgi:hypothetical protein